MAVIRDWHVGKEAFGTKLRHQEAERPHRGKQGRAP